MRVFVTGSTGFIGTAVVKELLGAGHQVLGLTRSEAGANALAALGAEAHHGSLEDLESLRRGAAASDGVIHLAFIHGVTDVPLAARLRIILGGSPSGIVSRFMAAAMGADQGAIETFGAALAGSGRPLVVSSGTMLVSAGSHTTASRPATEEDAGSSQAVGAGRVPSEDAALGLAARDVRASVVRLSPSVHGDGDGGLIPQLISIARKKGVSAYVGDGKNRWPAVHRLDAARLFRVALEHGEAGARYHGVADEGVPFREIAEIIGRRLNVPVVSKSPKEAASHLSWLAPFVAADDPASSKLTQDRLGWGASQPGLLADLDRAAYFGS